jgi:hypothetical protein
MPIIMITLSARSYPRHACPLYGAVFMQVHGISKTPSELAGLHQNDPSNDHAISCGIVMH